VVKDGVAVHDRLAAALLPASGDMCSCAWEYCVVCWTNVLMSDQGENVVIIANLLSSLSNGFGISAADSLCPKGNCVIDSPDVRQALKASLHIFQTCQGCGVDCSEFITTARAVCGSQDLCSRRHVYCADCWRAHFKRSIRKAAKFGCFCDYAASMSLFFDRSPTVCKLLSCWTRGL
jgi:hypothetical protein